MAEKEEPKTEKTLSFTDTSSQTVKIGDTTTSFTLICGNGNTAIDLTNATSITVKLGNASGYLKSVEIDPTKLAEPWTGKITVKFSADLINSLPAGSYVIEVWVVDSTGTSIYPSNGSTGFTIANNIQSQSGSTITTITFDDFVKAMNKAASTIAKGDPGEGLDIKGQVTSVSALPTTANEGDGYLVNEELYVYTSGAWKDCGPIQGPQGIQGKTGTGISSTTIQYQISSSATTSPTGTWSNSIVATTITNPYLWMKATLNYTDGTTKDFYLVSQKGDRGEKGDTGTVDNAGLTTAPAFVNLQTQVTNSAVGTNLLINTSSSATNGKTTFPGGIPAILGTYSRTDSYEQVTSPSSGEYFYRFTDPDIINNLCGLVAGETYTISGKAVINKGTLSFQTLANKGAGWYGWYGNFNNGSYDLNATNSDEVTYTSFSYTFTVPVDATGIFLSLHVSNYTANTVFRFKNMKLEKGSVATDWCPNPSEILTQSDYAKIQAAIVALGGSLK